MALEKFVVSFVHLSFSSTRGIFASLLFGKRSPNIVVVDETAVVKGSSAGYAFALLRGAEVAGGSVGFCERDALIMLLLKRKTEFIYLIAPKYGCS